MIITNSITDSTGTSRTNVFMTGFFDTSTAEVDGIIKFTPSFWKDETARGEGKDRLFIIEDGSVVEKISFNVVSTDIVKSGVNCTVAEAFNYFKTLAANQMELLYGWEITI